MEETSRIGGNRGRIILVFILLVIAFLLGARYGNQDGPTLDGDVRDFSKLFVETVLLQEEEVTAEQRLELENDVRSLGNQDILEQWNRFTESEDSLSAEDHAVHLIYLLFDNIEK